MSAVYFFFTFGLINLALTLTAFVGRCQAPKSNWPRLFHDAAWLSWLGWLFALALSLLKTRG